MSIKSGELGLFWAREAAKELRQKATRIRNAYRTPFMTAQTFPVADAYDRAAKCMDEATAELERRQEAPGQGRGEGE